MDSVGNGRLATRNAVPRKPERNGVPFTHLALLAARILDADGATMVQEPEKDCACQVEPVVRAVEAWTLAHSNDGTLPNVLLANATATVSVFQTAAYVFSRVGI